MDNHNHRILSVDDTSGDPRDFRKIPCPGPGPGNPRSRNLKAAVIEKAHAATATEFEARLRFPGQEALETGKQALRRPAFEMDFLDVSIQAPGGDGVEDSRPRLWQVLSRPQIVICHRYRTTRGTRRMRERLDQPTAW